MFITIEGADGCGKTTLIENLKKKYSEKFVFTKEPGGTAFGKQIKEIIFNGKGEIDNLTVAYLFATDRCYHIQNVIKPLLKQGKIVVSDRFVFSSYVYQGYVDDLGVDIVKQINKIALDGVEPDLIIYLKNKKSFRLVPEDLYDIQSNDESKKIRDGFDQLFQGNNSVFSIDVDNYSTDEVFAIVDQKLKEII